MYTETYKDALWDDLLYIRIAIVALYLVYLHQALTIATVRLVRNLQAPNLARLQTLSPILLAAILCLFIVTDDIYVTIAAVSKMALPLTIRTYTCPYYTKPRSLDLYTNYIEGPGWDATLFK